VVPSGSALKCNEERGARSEELIGIDTQPIEFLTP
jgi:hypothetical protein